MKIQGARGVKRHAKSIENLGKMKVSESHPRKSCENLIKQSLFEPTEIVAFCKNF